MQKCCLEGCERPVYVKKYNFCRAHYLRWWRYGSPILGGTFYGDPEKFIKNVALNYEDDECLIWPFGQNSYGYAMWGSRYVTRIVCEETNGPPPEDGYDAAHSCGKGHIGCISPKHLSWKSRTDNHADKVGHGTAMRGEKVCFAKLTEAEVLEIRASTHNQRETADFYGVDQSTISDIRRRKSWDWL